MGGICTKSSDPEEVYANIVAIVKSDRANPDHWRSSTKAALRIAVGHAYESGQHRIDELQARLTADCGLSPMTVLFLLVINAPGPPIATEPLHEPERLEWTRSYCGGASGQEREAVPLL